ncbi:UDP-N-acetylmuramoyl-tripeptide--D-alanyl-D-alanine ligase [Paenibacillus chartarius]|uniref:UDP-N-acetylmuramoyl-tripeptide--D-alanyl-D-alanine ligase n=1 Tax=Paenibacillus chartarius TaxID=747481 RepID=A0ABV6DND4_9BACL
MMRRTIAQIERMLARRYAGQLESRTKEEAERLVIGVSTDTRTIAQGNLFVPLVGEKFDGHQYAQQAVDKGAAAVLWQRGHEAEPPQGAPLILVDDTLGALQQLAKAYRQELDMKVVGITGSNGKTTTKDLVHAVLAVQYRVHKTQGNLNNHIGLPLTLLQLSEDTEAAVLEMGMSGRGEIELLSGIGAPDIAVITIIGESHLEQLGSREEIARAKVEILSGLADGGLFVYNGDSELIEAVLPEMPKPKTMRTVRFGMGQDCDLFASNVQMTADGAHFTLNDGGAVEFAIPLLGRHNVTNAIAAIAVGRELGISDECIAEGLASVQMTGMRIEVRQAPSGLTVLNDAYNASPTSMEAALKLLAELGGFRCKFAVLGDMLELGPQEAELHRGIGERIGPETADYLLTYGERARHIADGALIRLPADRIRSFNDKRELAQHLLTLAEPNDVVLVKGSRGMRLEDVVAVLLGDEPAGSGH